ncbi:MAG TPA: flagellar biosynthesis regulator FlaF [Sphingomonadaceae bacterium]|jgi:flagellar protein FlaF|nr:flagellar biosynthesis regulator FlaF [Sphingomonadaceae bacterium]
MSLDAYRRVQSISATPRATEYRLLSQVTGELIRAKEEGLTGAALMRVLHHNREVWSTFAILCGSPGNKLPTVLRAGIISLALWVEHYTSDVVRKRDSIDGLIDVNRTIMEGLATENAAH